ncbi:MAG: UDP-N-acetylmuramoyl-L-alanyl-D-glutamate--2,6-diaminopimelate ligase [Solirubrobacterales bacterium]
MRLDQIAGRLEDARIEGDPSTEVSGLAYDNRKVESGWLYFCVPGSVTDGHLFAPEAVSAGASALVVDRPLGLEVAEVEVPDVRQAMAPIAAEFEGDPTASLTVAGITGTNGKTTTAFLLRDLLEADGRQTGLIGTVRQVVGGREEEVERTTPESVDLQATFRRMLDQGDSACVMEVSSHALDQHRADAIRFDLAVFTNLTQDHLDYHGDMESYFLAKRRLFEMEPRVALVNADDPYGRRLAEEFGATTFSTAGEQADFVARGIEFDRAGARFTVDSPGGELRVEVPLAGAFNVSNAVASLAGAILLGVEPEVAVRGLAGASPVPGRLEPVDRGQDFAVFVDYAHTPDSVANVLEAARELTRTRLITVIGAGGDRDRGKRPLMGEAAGRLSDLTVVTSDNPRSEPPELIVGEVAAGIPAGCEVVVEVDRDAAIGRAIEAAGPGDTVVIAGKGHEQGQEFEDGRKIPFDDREVARRHLGGRT